MQNAISYLHSEPLDKSIRTSLAARMQFRLELLSMLYNHATVDVPSKFERNTEKSLLETIQATRSTETPVPDAFTLKIQRRLASTVPPRPMVTIDDGRTFEYLKRFLTDCENVYTTRTASHSHDSLLSYFIFNSQDPQPSVYVRALMQAWLNTGDITGSSSDHFTLMANDMQSITLPASMVLEAFHSNDHALSGPVKLVRQYFLDFVNKTERSFFNIWRTFCLNRCRIRRTLCHAALEWDNIQAEAEELDEELQNLLEESATAYPAGGSPTFPYSISSWVYHYKLTHLRLVVQLGFELDIYAPYEFASMYWYLAHLCDTHLAHLERVSFFVTRQEAAAAASSNDARTERRRRKECQETLRHLYRHFSWLKATEATAKALHAIYTVLQRHMHFKRPPVTYASESLRYELRMRPFLHLSVPEPITYEQLQRLSSLDTSTEPEILDQAAIHAAVAKQAWEEVMKAKWHGSPLRPVENTTAASVTEELWAADLRGIIKSTIGASITIATLKKYVLLPEPRRAMHVQIPQKGDKDHWHAWWLVPKITP